MNGTAAQGQESCGGTGAGTAQRSDSDSSQRHGWRSGGTAFEKGFTGSPIDIINVYYIYYTYIYIYMYVCMHVDIHNVFFIVYRDTHAKTMYGFHFSISSNSRIEDVDLEKGLKGATRFELKHPWLAVKPFRYDIRTPGK